MKLKPIVIALSINTLAMPAFTQHTASELLKFGQHKIDEGSYDKAILYYSEALNFDSTSANAYYLRSEAYYLSNQFFESLQDVESAIKYQHLQSSDQANYLVHKALCHTKLDQHTKAQEAYLQALDKSPNDHEVNYAFSRYCFEIGKIDLAYKHINNALTLEHKTGDYYLTRAQIAIQKFSVIKGNEAYQQIISDFDKALEINPNDSRVFESRSFFFNSINEEQLALDDFNNVVSLSNGSNSVYTERGMIKLQQKNYVGAINDFSASIDMNPEIEINYRMRAVCLHNIREYHKAIADYSLSIDKLREQYFNSEMAKKEVKLLAETYLMRGNSYNAIGKSIDACDDYVFAYSMGFPRALNYYYKYCKH